MLISIAAALALTASPGCPKTRPEEPPPISANPDWQVKPDYKDIYWAFPPRAVAERRAGRAVITCEVSIQGAAEACKVVSEEPAGYGFGEAAVALTSKMLFKPKIECGKVVPATIQVPIAFQLPPMSDGFSTAPLDPKDQKLVLAARLVEALKVVDRYRAMFDDESWALIEMAQEERQVSAEEREVMHDASRATWASASGKLLNAHARALSSHFTEAELRAALDFYEGPVGSKLISLDPTVGQEVGEVFEAMQPDIILEFHRRYCEKMQSLCAPEDAT